MGSGSADANRDRERRPDVGSHVTDFVSRTVHGPMRVLASGPTVDLRSAEGLRLVMILRRYGGGRSGMMSSWCMMIVWSGGLNN